MTDLFVEPSGIVIPFELRNQISAAGRDAKVALGPVVFLVDAAEARTALAEDLAHITRQQATQSDLLVINKKDIADPDEVDWLEGSLRGLSPEPPIHRVSLQSGEGVADLLAAVLEKGKGGDREG